MGTAVDRDYFVNGRLHDFRRIFRWRDWLLLGLFFISFGVYIGFPDRWAPGTEDRALPAMVLLVVGGGASVAQGLRQLLQDRAVNRAMDREFFPEH